MPTKIAPEVVCWDSCIFIDFFKKTADRHEYINALVNKAKRGKIIIAYSCIVLPEVSYFEEKAGNQPRKASHKEIDIIEEFMNRPYLSPISTTQFIGSAAQRIRNAKDVRITPIDATIIASSIVECIPILLTYDGSGPNNRTPMLALNNKFNLGFNTANPKLKVMTPNDYWQTDPEREEFFGKPDDL